MVSNASGNNAFYTSETDQREQKPVPEKKEGIQMLNLK